MTWAIIPGIDVSITPFMNTESTNVLPLSTVNIKVATARKILPIIIAVTREQYINGFF